jgi:thymidylate kinase
MKLICITGIDGAGKTTLARNLVDALNGRGQPAVYLYGRTYPIISRLLMALGRAVFLRGKSFQEDYPTYNADKKHKMRNPLLRWLYTISILGDYYLQIWLKLLPYVFSNRIVVLDRYVYDTVISDLTVHLNYTAQETDKAIKRGLWFVPTPVLTALIDLPEEVAFSRKDDVPHIEYLQERRSWYLRLEARPEVQKFDGTNAASLVLQNISSEVNFRAAS